MPWSFSTDKLEQIDEENDGRDSPGPSSSRKGELRNVREFLETLSTQLAGGTLEATRVRPLYDHPAYLPSRSRSPRSPRRTSGGASGAHAHLKRLVARVVEEAAALPELARYAAEPTRLTPTIESSTYEDLLATAILNKVIERYQTENGSGGRSSGIHSASASPSPTPSERSSPRSLHSRHNRDISPPLRDEDVSDWEEGEATDDALELPRRVPFPEFGGDIVHNNENDIRDFDEVSCSDIQAVDGTWEENWLFQKKKIKTTQSVPVPMLVPNSNTDYRVLIGDRDADDTTDLSDNASDAEEDMEYKSDIKRIVDSKHVIGGSIKIDDNFDFEPDSLDVVDGINDFENMYKEEESLKNKVIDAVNNEVNDVAVTKIQKTNVQNEDFTTINNTVNNEMKQKTDYEEANDVMEKNNTKPIYINGHSESNLENSKNSVLVLGVDSGPLTKAEFALKEEIHRTTVNGYTEKNTEDLDDKSNGHDETMNDSEKEVPVNNTSTPSTLSRHQREREYDETIRIPVQRHVDSLRRKHFEDERQQVPTRDTDNDEDLIPGSIAYRERKKWLNYVEMPNNPYSPEAIQKRLSTKSNSSLFDMFTSKNKDNEDSTKNVMKVTVDENEEQWKQKDITAREIKFKKTSTLSDENITNGTRSKSPSPKILKDALSEEVPQYKRYGRDYYIKEAKASRGGRKKNSFSDTSSLSSINKSTSLDNFDTDYASPVSASSSFSDLEACALHQNIVRTVFSPRNASPNFAINPIFEYPDLNNKAEYKASTDKRNFNQYANVRQQNKVYNGNNGVENEDIVRLKIPNKPTVTEDLLETYNSVRRSDSLRSDDLNGRNKRQGLNFTYGGSLRDY